jgi:hypothetical protein
LQEDQGEDLPDFQQEELELLDREMMGETDLMELTFLAAE